MAKSMSKGKCFLCDGIFGKTAMTKHIKSCMKKSMSKTLLEDKKKSFHIFVEGRYLREYWMHIAAPADITLEALDKFLRNIWLECCGHLSAFTIGSVIYSIRPMKEYGERSMKVALGNLLSPGIKFYHEYDFGTPTRLTLKVVSEIEDEIKNKSIKLLARNEPPEILCESCGKIATQICTQCVYAGKGWLCDECGQNHRCGEEMLLPVVNSPRVGMCGYVG